MHRYWNGIFWWEYLYAIFLYKTNTFAWFEAIVQSDFFLRKVELILIFKDFEQKIFPPWIFQSPVKSNRPKPSIEALHLPFWPKYIQVRFHLGKTMLSQKLENFESTDFTFKMRLMLLNFILVLGEIDFIKHIYLNS